jgi:hypothetical protein
MVRLTYSSPTSYVLSTSTSTNNRPIAEAGFTITGLQPNYANSSNGILTQAQNYVLLGGHTKTAFTNMSQVALFSLPQEVWSFQSIDAAQVATGELAKAAVTTPDPRSGHTAILSLDGSSIVVFGGWVGNVNNPAEPQLAVLHVGSGFGGSGDWAWQLPATTGAGLASGEGIYGHGALMLPGNVMMIVGGTRIKAPPSSKLAKKADSTAQAMFLNMTSMTWVSNYTNPGYSSLSAVNAGNSGSLDPAADKRRIGIGAGLGLGLSALLAAVLFFFWYRRRVQQKRDAREKDLQQLSRNAADFHAVSPSGGSNEGWWSGSASGEMAQTGGFIPVPQSNTLGNRSMGIGRGSYTSLSFGQSDNDPSAAWLPNRGSTNRGPPAAGISRKPVNGRNTRGYYQAAPTSNSGYDGYGAGGHSRANSLGTSGLIHPIYEAEEEHDVTYTTAPHSGLDNGISPAATTGIEDPFQDPPSVVSRAGSHNTSSRPGTGSRTTPTPEEAARVEREREVKAWVADWALAADALHNRASAIHHHPGSGRASPSKDHDRTTSNLSEKSVVSAMTLSRAGSASTRGAALFAQASSWLRSATSASATAWAVAEYGDQPQQQQSQFTGDGRKRANSASRLPPNSAGSSGGGSFATAQTSFGTLRAEAEGLLVGGGGGGLGGSRPGTAPGDLNYVSSGSPSKTHKAAVFTRQVSKSRMGWLGSLKRLVVGGEDEWVSSSEDTDLSSRSSPTRGQYYDSAGASPIREVDNLVGGSPGGPRRTMSATATMWRRKQGRDDWEADEMADSHPRTHTLTLGALGESPFFDSHAPPTTSAASASRTPSPTKGVGAADDEEWDIEKAIERRVVQVMFTVPKEKLRVVNHDFDNESNESTSVKSPQLNEGDIFSDAKAISDVEAEIERLVPTPQRAHLVERARAENRKLEEREREMQGHERSGGPVSVISRPGSPGKVMTPKGNRVSQIVDRFEARQSPVF